MILAIKQSKEFDHTMDVIDASYFGGVHSPPSWFHVTVLKSGRFDVVECDEQCLPMTIGCAELNLLNLMWESLKETE